MTLAEHMTLVTGAAVAPTEMIARGATPIYSQRAWLVVASGATLALCTLPANAFVFGADVWVQQAFNSSGADDAIEVGWAADHDSYVVSLAIVATGVKTPVLGAAGKTVEATHPIIIYYSHTGDAPTTGRVLVTIYYTVAPAVPS